MSTFDDLQQALSDTYRIERELGGGGMSRVFLANDLALSRQVVLKVLPGELAAVVNVERFNRETLLLARLQHPHIVPVLNVGSLHGLPWFSMPYIDGESLRARIDRVRELPIADVVSVVRDVAKALAYAQQRGVVHRDIKPDNILLTGDSATVADFGIAKAINAARSDTVGDAPAAALTQMGMAIGTPAYMSPEQVAGSDAIDHRSDIYALGCVAYEMLCGTAPFADRPFQLQLAAHLTEDPPPIAARRPDVPAPLAALVMQCLSKDPASRPQDARDVVRALEQAGMRSGEVAGATSSPSTVWRALATWGAATVVVGLFAQVATTSIGLPTWVLPAAMVMMALGLPVIVLTGVVQRVARTNTNAVTPRSFGEGTLTPGRATPASATPGGATPGGATPTPTVAPTPSSLTRLARSASPHVTWRRVERASYVVIGAFVLAIAAFMGFRAMGVGPAGSLQASGALAPRERIAMTDFAVRGADTLLGRVAADAVRAGLVQSGALTLLTPTDIGGALQRMQRPRDSKLSLELVRELATREGVRAIVDGDLTAVGTQYVLAVRLVTADSGRELASYRASASSTDGLIQMADELSRKLRARVGESLRTVNAAPPLERVTTTSLEALRRYSDGVRASDVEGNQQRAVALLRQAVAMDTMFALAWRKLGVILATTTSNPGAADSALNTAYRLRDRLTDIDAARVEAAYFTAGAHPDRTKSIRAYERVIALGDSTVLGNLASIYESRREFARAEQLRRLVIQRDSGVLRLSLLRQNLRLQGRWSAIDSVEGIVRRRFPNDQLNSSWASDRATLAGDLTLHRRLLDSAVVHGDVRNPVQTLIRQMMQAVEEGRLHDADRFQQASFAVYRAQGVNATDFTAKSLSIEFAAAAGVASPQAVREYEQALDLETRTSKTAPALAAVRTYAKLGMAAKARSALATYERTVTDSNLRARNQGALPPIMIDLAIAERRYAEAAAMLRREDQKPDGPADNCGYCLPLALVRVFAMAGQADSALVQYDAYRRTPMGSRPRIGPDLTVPAPTMLALARIYDARGDARNAITAYRDYALRLERADAELQVNVREARARMQALSPVEPARR